MKKFLVLFISLALAIGIVVVLPTLINTNSKVDANITNEVSLVNQTILSYEKKEHTYNKIYVGSNLIAVINDLDYLNSKIAELYKTYEEEFPNTELSFSNDINIVSETSGIYFDDVDDEIVDYLNENKLLGIKTTAVEFSTSEGVYDIIYVKSKEDFEKARNQFLLNFVSEETLNKLQDGEVISEPTKLGTIEKSVSVAENMSYSEIIVSPDKIFTDVNTIYEYLCYGRNTQREYYTVKQGDTLQGVGYYFNDMTAKQLVMLNPDVLSSETQIITPGTQLNVTYYTSPITVNVIKENLTQEYIVPETPEYIEDDTIDAGRIEIIVQEESGIKNVLYEEKWTNGVLQSGEAISETIIKQPVRGQIRVGSKVAYMVGTGNYIWPVDNPRISCHYGCYLDHTGTDFVNRYNSYGSVYAIDSGVVVSTGYKDDMGNFVIIDHQNGIRTFYMHLNVPPYVEEGDNVSRGQVIGQIGNTGYSFGAHLHLTFEVDGERVNACNYLPCDLLE